MGALLIILPYHVVGEEGFSATRRAKNELVAVGGYATFHRLVGYVKVQRLTCKPVNHLYAEWRQGGTVVSFRREEADSRFKKCVETFLGRKISLIAAQNNVGQSMVLWRGIQPITASWLPTSFLTLRSSSASSLHAITLKCALTEISPYERASFR